MYTAFKAMLQTLRDLFDVLPFALYPLLCNKHAYKYGKYEICDSFCIVSTCQSTRENRNGLLVRLLVTIPASKAPIEELSQQAAERLDGLRCTDTVGSAQRGKELNTQSALADRDSQPSQTCQTLHALFWGCLVKKLVWCEKFLSWFSERKGVKGMSCERVVMHHLLALLNMFNLRHREVDKSCIKSKWGNKSAIMS